jgi:hypothetical protein
LDSRDSGGDEDPPSGRRPRCQSSDHLPGMMPTEGPACRPSGPGAHFGASPIHHHQISTRAAGTIRSTHKKHQTSTRTNLVPGNISGVIRIPGRRAEARRFHASVTADAPAGSSDARAAGDVWRFPRQTGGTCLGNLTRHPTRISRIRCRLSRDGWGQIAPIRPDAISHSDAFRFPFGCYPGVVTEVAIKELATLENCQVWGEVS